MKNHKRRTIDALCPRCDYLLVPVHLAGDRSRSIRSYCCPDPYCDYTLDARALEPRGIRFWRGLAGLAPRSATALGDPDGEGAESVA